MGLSKVPLLLTPFGELELINALELRSFRKELDSAQVEAALSDLRKDLEDGVFAWSPVPETMYQRARKIIERRTAQLGVRTLDILHVALALDLQAGNFYTFDHRQRKLAIAEGLKAPDLTRM